MHVSDRFRCNDKAHIHIYTIYNWIVDGKGWMSWGIAKTNNVSQWLLRTMGKELSTYFQENIDVCNFKLKYASIREITIIVSLSLNLYTYIYI